MSEVLLGKHVFSVLHLYANTLHDYAVKLGEGSNTGESVCLHISNYSGEGPVTTAVS